MAREGRACILIVLSPFSRVLRRREKGRLDILEGHQHGRVPRPMRLLSPLRILDA